MRHPARGAIAGALLLCLAASGCGAPDVEAEGEDPLDLHEVFDGERRITASCPNGGNVAPNAPYFKANIDAHASYVGQSLCDPTAKPGASGFKSLVLATYPCTGDYGIVRACNVGGLSEHKEGRAWDWKVNYPHAAADSLLKWLLATDAYGNKHAMARRLGIMYMIWNRKIWRAYRANDGWQPYSGSNPHTDHVHFSLSWDGARKSTTFWNPPPSNKPPQGWLDVADCKGIRGWSQDPDTPKQSIEVQVFFDGKPGDPGALKRVVTADQYRNDLCSAIGSCKHGFEIDVPAKLLDGAEHVARAYGIDSTTGNRTQLGSSPKNFTCTSPAADADADANAGAGPDAPDGFDFGGPATSWPDAGPAAIEAGASSPHLDEGDVDGVALHGGCAIMAPGAAAGAEASLLAIALLLVPVVAATMRKRSPRSARHRRPASANVKSSPTNCSRRPARHWRPLAMPPKLPLAPPKQRFAGYAIGSPAPHAARSAICREALKRGVGARGSGARWGLHRHGPDAAPPRREWHRL